MNEKVERHEAMLKIYDDQPYETQIAGINVLIEKDVFPSDKGYTTSALLDTISKYSGDSALDMGCGCGILALIMAKQNFKNVIAIDRHRAAAQCAINNVMRNNYSSTISVYYGDMFSPLKNKKIIFDLIVFNFPYFPTVGKPVFGYDPDGGKRLLERFFHESKPHINRNTKIILPFSDICGRQNDPSYICKDHGFLSSIVKKFCNDGQTHLIYELTIEGQDD